jgi:hypothetical protein
MKRRFQLAALIIGLLVVVGLVEAFVEHDGPSAQPLLDETNQRFDAITAALSAYAADHGRFPAGSGWARALNLSDDEIADPFMPGEPLALWSNGRWYVLSSNGPDAAKGRWAADQSVDPAESLRLSRQLHPELFDVRTAAELSVLLGDNEILGDIRFRWAIYDPTNGVDSQGDVARWRGLSQN